MPPLCLMWLSSPTESVGPAELISEELYCWFQGNIYLGGPPLVKAATGEVVTGEELGGLNMSNSTSSMDKEYNLSRSYHALLCQWNYRPFCQR